MSKINKSRTKYYCKTTKCPKCIYRSASSDLIGCNYFFIKNEMRNCDPGDNCTKFIKGPRINLIDKGEFNDHE